MKIRGESFTLRSFKKLIALLWIWLGARRHCWKVASAFVEKWGGRGYYPHQEQQPRLRFQARPYSHSRQQGLIPMTLGGLASWAYICSWDPETLCWLGLVDPASSASRGKSTGPSLSQSRTEMWELIGLRFLWIWLIWGKAKGFISASHLVPSGRLPGLNFDSNDCLLVAFPRARWMKMSRKY